MNEYDQFLKALLLRNTDSKAPENQSKIKGKLVDGPKSFPGKQTGDPGLLSACKVTNFEIFSFAVF